MLSVVCWKWKSADPYRSTFGPEQVNVLRNMVERHYPHPHEMVCVTDDPVGIDPRVRIVPLWNDHANIVHPAGRHNPSCYRRLKAFARGADQWFGERFVSLDLDTVIVGDMTPVWDRPEDFVIWGDTNPTTPYNGSMFLLRSGTRPQVWEKFDPRKSIIAAKKLRYWGSDQSWIGACLGPNEPKWSKADGVYSFRIHFKQAKLTELPENARIVFFHGEHDPWQPFVQKHYPWVAQHWC